MKNIILILALASPIWSKGVSISRGGGHSSARAISADRANLAKARASITHAQRTTASAVAADRANLVKARATRAKALKLNIPKN